MDRSHRAWRMRSPRRNRRLRSPKRFNTKDLALFQHVSCSMIAKALVNFESWDPNTERFSKMLAAVHKLISCYKMTYDEKKKETLQTSLDKLFKEWRSNMNENENLRT